MIGSSCSCCGRTRTSRSEDVAALSGRKAAASSMSYGICLLYCQLSSVCNCLIPNACSLPFTFIAMVVKSKLLAQPTTAMASFRTIVADIAGPRETARAHALIARTIEVPDDISARCIELRPSNSISPKSLPVFGTADKLGRCSICLTAASGGKLCRRDAPAILTAHPPTP